MSESRKITHWIPRSVTTTTDQNDPVGVGSVVDALCLGTGRFLRAVLVPSLVNAGIKPALIQPRGQSFLEYMAERDRILDSYSELADRPGFYPVDTVEPDGTVVTDEVPCWGAFSIGSVVNKEALVDWLPSLKRW
jgi:hypothetical protein